MDFFTTTSEDSANADAPGFSEVEQLSQLIDDADAVLVGVGSGLSSAAGYNHYHWSPYFAEKLGPFREKYGFKSPFDGFYYLFSNYEEQWGYYAAYIKAMVDAPTGKPYEDLAAVLRGKPCHVISTNIDGQVSRVFPHEAATRYQGDFAHLQCSQPCVDKVYPADDLMDKLVAHLDDNLAVPSDLVPRCELCGRVMTPWVRDDTFLEGTDWRREVGRYQDFLSNWAVEDKKLLLLELGVGEMTPGIIKLPFWALAQKLPHAYYVSANLSRTSAPLQLEGKSLQIVADLGDVLGKLAAFRR